MWAFKWSERAKAVEQYGHLKFFSPEWSFTCLLSDRRCLNPFPHTLHLKTRRREAFWSSELKLAAPGPPTRRLGELLLYRSPDAVMLAIMSSSMRPISSSSSYIPVSSPRMSSSSPTPWSSSSRASKSTPPSFRPPPVDDGFEFSPLSSSSLLSSVSFPPPMYSNSV